MFNKKLRININQLEKTGKLTLLGWMSKWNQERHLARRRCWGRTHQKRWRLKGASTRKHPSLPSSRATSFPQPSTPKGLIWFGPPLPRDHHPSSGYSRTWAKAGNLKEARFVANQLCESGKAAPPPWASRASSGVLLPVRESRALGSWGPPQQSTSPNAKQR